MAINIELKNNNTPGKVPAVTDLILGELAINTYDGKIYFKRKRDKVEEIISLSESASGAGTQGPADKDGKDGKDGKNGDRGPQGPKGEDGDSGSIIEWDDLEIYGLDAVVKYNDQLWVSEIPNNDYEPGENYELEDGSLTPAWNTLSAITSVFGRTDKNITAQSGDYNTSQVTENPSYLYFTEARVEDVIDEQKGEASGLAPLGMDNKVDPVYLPGDVVYIRQFTTTNPLTNGNFTFTFPHGLSFTPTMALVTANSLGAIISNDTGSGLTSSVIINGSDIDIYCVDKTGELGPDVGPTLIWTVLFK